MVLDNNDILGIRGIFADEIKPVYMAIEKASDKTIIETRKAIDEVRHSLDEQRRTADDARRTADNAKQSADDAHRKADLAVIEAKRADDASIKRDNECPIKAKIEAVEIKLARASGVVYGIRWTTGKLIGAVSVLLLAGGGIVEVVFRLLGR